MAEISSMSPIYFARKQQEEMSDEDYDASIAHNEKLLNENFKTLFDWMSDIASAVATMQTK